MRVDADDFARPCGDGKMHHEIKEILKKLCQRDFLKNIYLRF